MEIEEKKELTTIIRMNITKEIRDSKWDDHHTPDPNVKNDNINCQHGEWNNLAYEESIKFAIDQQSCQIFVFGSKAEKCTAEIVCDQFNFKPMIDHKCQNDSYLLIYDSYGGSLKSCGNGHLRAAYRASHNGRDLYIKYKGQSPGTTCHIVCGEDKTWKKNYKKLPLDGSHRPKKPCKCGVKPDVPSGRVVGGKTTKPFEYPWLAAVAYKNSRRQFCGGALINDRYVLSAAHCFATTFDVLPSEVDILLHAHVLDLNTNRDYYEGAAKGERGSLHDVPGLHEKNYTDKDENTFRVEVEEIIVHPLWNLRKLDYDVALVKLAKPVELMNQGQYSTICLPPIGQLKSYANKTAIVAGWGRPHETAGAASRLLQHLEVPVLTTRSCARLLDTIKVTPRMLCAGYLKGGHDSCVGDSGGPLIYKTNEGIYRQIGVVSFGKGCAQPASPGVYSNLQEVIQWIYHETDDATWCSASY